MDFVTSLLISTNLNDKSYDSILVIVDQLTKIIYYELVKITINTPDLTKVIIDVVICHYKVSGSIVMNQGLLFIS